MEGQRSHPRPEEQLPAPGPTLATEPGLELHRRALLGRKSEPVASQSDAPTSTRE